MKCPQCGSDNVLVVDADGYKKTNERFRNMLFAFGLLLGLFISLMLWFFGNHLLAGLLMVFFVIGFGFQFFVHNHLDNKMVLTKVCNVCKYEWHE